MNGMQGEGCRTHTLSHFSDPQTFEMKILAISQVVAYILSKALNPPFFP